MYISERNNISGVNANKYPVKYCIPRSRGALSPPLRRPLCRVTALPAPRCFTGAVYAHTDRVLIC